MNSNCCQPSRKNKPAGFLPGLFYGLLPHAFCIAFVAFSVVGATAFASFFKKFLLVPYFFQLLVATSLVFATISAVLYLKKNNDLSWMGVRRNKRYLMVLFGITISVNLLFLSFRWRRI